MALTTIDDDRTAASVLKEGGAGYLRKGVRQSALIGAIRAANDGVVVLPEGTAQRLVAGTPATAVVPLLTDRERDILVLLSDGRTNAQIANSLFVSVSTVKAAVGALLRKLEAKTRAELVARVDQFRLFD